MQFSQRLKELRKEQKLTQSQLSRKLNYGYTAIANYESGRNEPSMKDFVKLVNILNTNADYLLGNSDINYAKNSDSWQENVNKMLKKNEIHLERADQLFIGFLYSNIKNMAIQNDITKENFDEVYSKVIAESSQCFLNVILHFLQNQSYYNIIKQSIVNELNI